MHHASKCSQFFLPTVKGISGVFTRVPSLLMTNLGPLSFSTTLFLYLYLVKADGLCPLSVATYAYLINKAFWEL